MQLQLDRDANVRIQIISINGSVIKSFDRGMMTKGSYALPLELTVPHGVYVLKLIVDAQSYFERIVK